jgi:DegV family protein with EDD domain
MTDFILLGTLKLMAVKIVTDSTADLPPELAASLGIAVVPLNVHFGAEVYKDGVDLSAEDFYRRLVDGKELPKTSQPSPGDFVEAYERVGQGADGILSVHISSKLSGTYNAALLAKGQANVSCPIELIDTLQASMGVGVVAMSAARAAQRGMSMEEVAAISRDAVMRCECFALLDTLEYLERGGRVGKAKALLGTLLRIKPLVIVRDGEVHELGKERTRLKAIERFQAEARGFAPLEELCVLYSTAPDEARLVAERLAGLLPSGKEPFVSRFGPVLGTYVGPGAIGIGLLRSEAPSGSPS